MVFALLFIGLALIVVSIKGNMAAAFAQLESDFSGSGSFIYWLAAIVLLAVIGKVLEIPNAAKTFIALILVVYLFSNTGIWTQATQAFANLQAPAAVNPNETATTATTPTASSGTIAGQIGGVINTAAGGLGISSGGLVGGIF